MHLSDAYPPTHTVTPDGTFVLLPDTIPRVDQLIYWRDGSEKYYGTVKKFSGDKMTVFNHILKKQRTYNVTTS